MTELRQVYKCEICGNIVEVLHTGAGTLVCCGQPMTLLEEKTKDEGMEKHVPVVKNTKSGVKVLVGSVPHPMEEKHFIEWIEIMADGKVCRRHLKPGDKPEVEFETRVKKVVARELCNVHGLWRG